MPRSKRRIRNPKGRMLRSQSRRESRFYESTAYSFACHDNTAQRELTSPMQINGRVAAVLFDKLAHNVFCCLVSPQSQRVGAFKCRIASSSRPLLLLDSDNRVPTLYVYSQSVLEDYCRQSPRHLSDASEAVSVLREYLEIGDYVWSR